MRLFIFFIVVVIFCFSCDSNKSKSVYFEEKKGDTTIQGYKIADSLFHGQIKYIFRNDYILAIKNYAFGKLDGKSQEFYQNGMCKTETSFKDGIKNGLNRYFDESGRCFYQDNYYYGLPVGPILYFDTARRPKIFYFANLENKNVVAIDYNDWGGIETIYESCISFTTNKVKVDSTQHLNVFLYLISAPRMSFKYAIVRRKANQSHNDFVEVVSVNDTLPFTNISLKIPNDFEVYAIKASIYDSIKMKPTVIFKDL